jgi:hypothetical protein
MWVVKLIAAAIVASLLGSLYTILITERAVVSQFVVGFAWMIVHLTTLAWTFDYPPKQRAVAILLTAAGTAIGSTLAILLL